MHKPSELTSEEKQKRYIADRKAHRESLEIHDYRSETATPIDPSIANDAEGRN